MHRILISQSDVSSITHVTCAPPFRSLKRALGLVGYGLNRLALGPQNVKRDMVHADNLVRATRTGTILRVGQTSALVPVINALLSVASTLRGAHS